MMIDSSKIKEEAESIIVAAAAHNRAENFLPPWLAGLRLGAVAIDVLLLILSELRIANEPKRRRVPTDV